VSVALHEYGHAVGDLLKLKLLAEGFPWYIKDRAMAEQLYGKQFVSFLDRELGA
jgi:hypothetical protein